MEKVELHKLMHFFNLIYHNRDMRIIDFIVHHFIACFCISCLYQRFQEESVLICSHTYNIFMQSFILLGEPGLSINYVIVVKPLSSHIESKWLTAYQSHFSKEGWVGWV